ncbi:MAG TPA: UDP-N-acetylmuramate dehydrogenase, partial [Bacteroidota bacterium]
ATLLFAQQERLSVQVFSGGSNIIFADEGFDGVVLNVALRGFHAEESRDDAVLTVGAGEPWDSVVERAAVKGWGGIECLSGIPGSTGGTPVQNVGAYGQEVGETLTSVRAFDRRTLKEREFPRDECGFGYRESRFKGSDADLFIITEVRIRLKRNLQPEIRYPELARELESRETERLTPAAVRAAVIALRRRKSMVIDAADKNTRSAGSFFTNPVVTKKFFDVKLKGVPIPAFPVPRGVKLSAAWLVEHSGFPKGFRMGGAGISEHHALAIVNRGGTTADVMALAGEIEERVYGKFGIRLQREPVVVRYKP